MPFLQDPGFAVVLWERRKPRSRWHRGLHSISNLTNVQPAFLQSDT